MNRSIGLAQLVVLTSILVLTGCGTTRDITKQMHDKELQRDFLKGRIAANWSRTEARSRLVQRWLFDRMVGANLEGVSNEELYIGSSTGDHRIRVRVLRPLQSQERLPAMLYLHGGGYMIGAPEQALPFFQELLRRRDLVIVAPAYRLSLDHPYPAGFADAYDTLLWMRDNADELAIQPDNFILAGHSAGGGMTAAITLKVRDTRAVEIAFQMPIYPMLDHHQNTESALNMRGALFWDTRANAFGWQQYLRDLEGGEVPAYASPALNDNYVGFPPTISFVGTLEPFLDETVAYNEAIEAAGVPTRFAVFDGAYHGFDAIAPDTTIGRAAIDFYGDAFAEFFDRYVAH